MRPGCGGQDAPERGHKASANGASAAGSGRRHSGDTSPRHPGLDPGPRWLSNRTMDRTQTGGWVTIMADCHRGTIDRLLIAQGQCEGMHLLTHDATLAAYGARVFVV